MEVGTLETNIEIKPERKRRNGVSGSGSGNGGKKRGGGGGGSGNGGGNDGSDNRNYEYVEQYQPDKSKVLMWFLLVVVLMTFGGLIGAYIVISTNGVLEWKPFDLPLPIWISTLLIFASSITYYLAQKAIYREDQPQAKKWLLTTTVFGAAFISSQLLVWFALVRSGVYVQSNPYAGFFYVLTAIHALHVLGGIVALGSIVLRAWNKTVSPEDSEKRKTMAQVVGWYWHFMGGLWLVLFLLLGLWK
jgi:cytochrome c oxidase subunit 3